MTCIFALDGETIDIDMHVISESIKVSAYSLQHADHNTIFSITSICVRTPTFLFVKHKYVMAKPKKRQGETKGKEPAAGSNRKETSTGGKGKGKRGTEAKGSTVCDINLEYVLFLITVC